MSPQHFRDLLHRFDLGAHGSCAPGIEELAGPGRRTVAPESLKILLEQVGADGSEVACEQVRQPVHLLFGQVFRSLQQAPAAFRQERFFSLVFQFFDLARPDLVDGLAQVTHDMKPIEDVDCTRGLFGNNGQIRFPHVAADKPQLPAPFRPEPIEKALEGLGGPVGADPQQAPFPLVQLIDQGDELVLAFPPADLVGAYGGNTTEITMFESPGDRHFHRAEDRVPTGCKGLGHFLPTQPFTPGGQEPGVGDCEMTFPHGPRQSFDFHLAGWALHPPWRVEEKNRQAPQGDKGKFSGPQGVVPGAPLAALGTDGLAAGLGPQRDHQRRRAGFSPSARVVDKTRLFFETVQDSLNVHPVWPKLRSFLEETFPGKVRQDAFFCKPRNSDNGASMEPRLCHGRALRVCAARTALTESRLHA